jgi:hypothetical protein
LLISGILSFIYISPKTPVEFFDVNASDEAAIRELTAEKDKMTDSAGTAASHQMDELMSCKRRMDRIALLYDVANNPQRVNASKSSIVEGFYTADKGTEALLRATNESYRAAEQDLQQHRKDVQGNKPGPADGETRGTPTTDQKVFEATIFRMQLEASFLRRFQAMLFWRRAR